MSLGKQQAAYFIRDDELVIWSDERVIATFPKAYFKKLAFALIEEITKENP